MTDDAHQAAEMSELALKTRYCAQMMAAACVLAETAPDDFHRRVLARSVLIYCHEFIRWARRAKNELRGEPRHAVTVRQLTQALDDLEHRDWGDYEQIRHKIAAHRQTIDIDLEMSITTGNEMWTSISGDALRILSEDARAIWNDLAGAHDMPKLDSFPPVSPELQAAIDADGCESAPDGVRAGVGSFDATRPDAVLATQGGDLGEQGRQIVDAVRNLRTLARLWEVVNGHEPYWRVVLAATVTEACTFYDLLIGTSSGSHQQPSLLVLLESGSRPSPAIAVLRNARDTADAAALAHVRELRNQCGAHVDDQLGVHEISRQMQTFEPDKLNAVLDTCFDALHAASQVELSLRTMMLFDAVFADMRRIDPPDAPSYGGT